MTLNPSVLVILNIISTRLDSHVQHRAQSKTRPSGLSFFYLSPPIEGSEHAALVDCMATVIGVRNLVLGLAMVAAALFNEKRTLGVLFLSFAILAVVDGIATNTAVGHGGGDHIGYAPVVGAIGLANLWTAHMK